MLNHPKTPSLSSVSTFKLNPNAASFNSNGATKQSTEPAIKQTALNPLRLAENALTQIVLKQLHFVLESTI
jgi:hypothetical protein